MTTRNPQSATRHISRTRYAFYVCVIVAAVILIYFLTVRELRNFLVPSSSMEPTLAASDYIFTMNAPSYEVGDVVVIDDPTLDGAYMVKRIVATEGDRVSIRWGALYRNGEYVSEPFTREPMVYDFPPPNIGPEFTVPTGEVFVLGDNRNNSDDSSNWGPDVQLNYAIPVSSIVGAVRGVYLPFNRIRSIERFPAITVPLD